MPQERPGSFSRSWDLSSFSTCPEAMARDLNPLVPGFSLSWFSHKKKSGNHSGLLMQQPHGRVARCSLLSVSQIHSSGIQRQKQNNNKKPDLWCFHQLLTLKIATGEELSNPLLFRNSSLYVVDDFFKIFFAEERQLKDVEGVSTFKNLPVCPEWSDSDNDYQWELKPLGIRVESSHF